MSPLVVVLALSTAFRIGVVGRAFEAPGITNWRGSPTHRLITTIWYPADPAAVETAHGIPPEGEALFNAGMAAPGAKVVATPRRLPLILLSHGTGGSALQLGWLATRLAAHGYIVAAVNHPGNSAIEPYTAQGFREGWERPGDLSAVLDAMLADSVFGARIDTTRIGAAGFPLGGYTVLSIAGASTDTGSFFAFCRSPAHDFTCDAQPEFPEAGVQFVRLLATDSTARASVAHANGRHADARVRAVFAMAPVSRLFSAEGVAAIRVPVMIVVGAADPIVPAATEARWAAGHLRGASLTVLPGQVTHYAFLDECTAAGRVAAAHVCRDDPSVDRAAIHRRVAAQATGFFDRTLGR